MIKEVPVYFSIKEFEKLREISGNYSSVFIITDNNTSRECLPILQTYLDDINYFVIETGSGEINKTISTCKYIWDFLINNKADRQSLLINLGGGLICDMGGFAAHSYKRGIDFINIPTSLLSMADAAVGNKTGVNFNNIKNQIGAFASPVAVFVYTGFLRTLDERQTYSGFAEVLKHALVADRSYWNLLKEITPAEINEQHLKRSLQIKQEITMQDPEELNIRKKLNFGHTIGHALESISIEKGLNQLLHGEAVAAGMICEAYLSRETGLNENDLEDITALLSTHFGLYEITENEFDNLWEYIGYDKKNIGGKASFTLLSNIGEATIDNFCTKEEVFDSLKYYSSLSEQPQLGQ
ncbi:MAG: 3-dehydroquinate synthase [Bacteroidia bacterium]